MWTNAQLKTNAKFALQTRYGIAIVVSLLAGLLSGGSPGLGSSMFSANFRGNSNNLNEVKNFFTSNVQVSSVLIAGIATFALLAAVAGTLFSVFVSAPITVGQNRFYLQNRLRQGDIGTLFSVFQSGFLNVVKTVFLKNLYIFLWSLLFVIPGIIKTYQYYMVEYILAENPNMDSARALEISRQMTQGQKLDIFLLRLSFIGWAILSIMSCGIGFIFLIPYVQATFAELYTVLRAKAITEGTVSLVELTGVQIF